MQALGSSARQRNELQTISNTTPIGVFGWRRGRPRLTAGGRFFVFGSSDGADETIGIGVMLSTTGSYSVVARSMLNGGAARVQRRSTRAATTSTLEPVVVNPVRRPRAAIVRSASDCSVPAIRHVVGCYTSSSRKEVIPCFEKFDGLLWYPSHYEGFESSDNVIYTGAAPNQHVLPLVDYLGIPRRLARLLRRLQHIWAWRTTASSARRCCRAAAPCLPSATSVGDTEVDQVIAAIIDQRPDFVFNNLIGTSAYAFFRAFRAACRARGIDQAAEIPVASCTLSEPELPEIGPDAVDGHLSSSVYFSSLNSPENAAFIRRLYADPFRMDRSRRPTPKPSYIAVKLLAAALLAGRHRRRAHGARRRSPTSGCALRKARSASTGRPFTPGSRRGSAARPPTGNSRCCWNRASRSRPIPISFSRRRALPARCALRC